MKKLSLITILVVIIFSSCIFEEPYPPELDSSININVIRVNEIIDYTGMIYRGFKNDKASITVYIEDYPENTTIVSGTLYEPLTTEKYLCIEPVLINKRDGLVKVQMSFSEPGEYVIKCNGFYSGSSRITQLYTQDFHTFTITVTE